MSFTSDDDLGPFESLQACAFQNSSQLKIRVGFRSLSHRTEGLGQPGRDADEGGRERQGVVRPSRVNPLGVGDFVLTW